MTLAPARPRAQTRKRAKRPETFDERIRSLADELLLALHWNRPSILFAVCALTSVEDRARRALGQAIEAKGYRVADYVLGDPESADIPLRLARKRNRSKSVYFVRRLSVGGAAALRSLNFRREYFIDKQLHAVLFLTPQEEALVAQHAPDFWAFRHRVVYFPDES